MHSHSMVPLSDKRKLKPIVVGTPISSWHCTPMIQPEIFILRCLSKYGFPLSSIMIGNIYSLTQDVRHHLVKGGHVVTKCVFSSAETSDLSAGLVWYQVWVVVQFFPIPHLLHKCENNIWEKSFLAESDILNVFPSLVVLLYHFILLYLHSYMKLIRTSH